VILSVVIVNYRVPYFLELCLHSVQKALTGLDSEIIVIDNHSADGSVDALRALFPGVRFHENQENIGFARACNQGSRLAGGEYILFLNPDTVLPEDFAGICLDFLRNKPRAGGLGVRMIDGGGRFLKESRRGFPSPWVAFCKLSGLTALFPGSRVFAGYYLGHLPADKSHPAPVLSGACLLVRRAVFEGIGAFDERFFMYAEDIDLSYRLEKAGYVNYFLADTTILHFKGESTQKNIRYVRQFYKAMSQFRRKHITGGLMPVFNMGMDAAIWVRAGISGIARLARGLTSRGSRGRSGRLREGVSATVTDGAAASPLSIWLTGDPAGVARLTRLLAASEGWVIAPDRAGAAEIIFCEGGGFSFRQCISALEEAAPYRHGQKARLYAAGSRSATGSADPGGRGESIVFIK
jgi:N-acetylglucosaminyl-diphospho-decaprenol L-rhamnosyltransferase